jgi:hypothetical protein
MPTSTINVTAQINEPLLLALYAALRLATTAMVNGTHVDPAELINAINAELEPTEATDH